MKDYNVIATQDILCDNSYCDNYNIAITIIIVIMTILR